jgi:MFS family permease
VEVAGRIVRASRRLPETVRALSWVSLANDAGSELAYPILPLFLTITLGAPVAVLGLIEGIAEGVTVALRGVAGRLSDRSERRKPWIVAGYALTAAARPVVAAAPAWGWVLGARLGDRLGKASRTAPRDALIRDASPHELVGESFGYHRALDTAGAIIGPLIAVGLLAAGLSLRGVLWIAVIPGVFALLLLRRVQEIPRVAISTRPESARLPRAFWIAVAVWVVFSIGNSSDVFLLLRARDLGLGSTLVVLAYALYNLVYSSLSWPLGALSDRLPRTGVLGGGLVVFAAVYLGFALGPPSWVVWPLFAVYGVYVAATEGVARAWISDRMGESLAGTAYGVFSTATGAALLVASVSAGLLWSHVGHAAPFSLGAASAAAALVLLGLSSRGRM